MTAAPARYRDGRWEVEVPGGGVARGVNLATARQAAAAALPGVRVEAELPVPLGAALAAVRERERLLRAWHEEQEAELRGLATGLVEHGFSRRDIAEIMGLSGHLVAKLLACREIGRS